MMACGVGLLGHWQQQNCYSRVFSDTARPQLGFNGVVQNIAHVPALQMLLLVSGRTLKSSHVGPPELLQPFFRGLAGRLSPAAASLASLALMVAASQPPPKTRRQLPLSRIRASYWSLRPPPAANHSPPSRRVMLRLFRVSVPGT